jgi:hypothetical protein
MEKGEKRLLVALIGLTALFFAFICLLAWFVETYMR